MHNDIFGNSRPGGGVCVGTRGLNSTQAVPAKNSIKFTYFLQRIFKKQDPYFDSFARSTFNSIRKGLQIQQIPRKKGNAGGTKM